MKKVERLPPLSEEEVSQVTGMAEQLATFPRSIRYFNDFHEKLHEILKAKARKSGLFKKKYTYRHIDGGIGIHVEYTPGLVSDSLYAVLAKGKSTKSFQLHRMRGHLTMEQEGNESIIARRLKGRKLAESLKGLFQLQPHILAITHEDGRQEKIEYR